MDVRRSSAEPARLGDGDRGASGVLTLTDTSTAAGQSRPQPPSRRRFDVAAWPPATAVSGADAATMKNTRSGTPSARRWSLRDSPSAGVGAVDGSLTDTASSSSPPRCGGLRRGRTSP